MISVSGAKLGREYFIRPTPLITISQQNNRTSSVRFGNSYKITLNGTIIAGKGNPYSSGTVSTNPVWYSGSNYSEYTNTGWNEFGPPRNNVDIDKRLGAILIQQRGLRELFASDGLNLRVYHTYDTGGNPALSCNCVVESINFEEGNWVDTCKYTVELTTYVIYHNEQGIINYPLGLPSDHPDAYASGLSPTNFTFLHGASGLSTDRGYESGAYIEDFSEDWSVEEDDQFFNVDDNGFIKAPAYRVTRNLSSTGRTAYFDDANIAGWIIAKDFVKNYLLASSGENLANRSLTDFYSNANNYLGQGYFISAISNGDYFNHTVSEDFSVTEGTYSLSETFILCSGGSNSGAMETYTMQVTSDHQNPLINVSINGSVQGLSHKPSGENYRPLIGDSGKYDSAIKHWGKISGSGIFGISSPIYKRANSAVGVALNAQPKSISIGLNKIQGTIDYTLEFDNRPTNFISGVSHETISINDTYPGDVFATIPVIGRKQGPIFQSMGTRTEYRRDVSLEFILDYHDTYYPSGNNNASRLALLKKPILYDPYRSQIIDFISGVCPYNEPGIRKYFMNPTTETWSPKEGRYSLNLSWTYEIDK